MNAIDYEIGETGGEFRGASESVIAGDVEALRPLPRISIHAFCISDAVHRTMEQCAADRRMARVSMHITHGNVAAAANMFSSTPTPNLIILETDAGPRDLLTELAPLAEVCDPSSRV
ncbi:MAG: CtpF protein, partial [Alphaproteobacteria bacterium]|nr:CtpF protein [Alphaproteobacteria bacterium]